MAFAFCTRYVMLLDPECSWSVLFEGNETELSTHTGYHTCIVDTLCHRA